ncbi:MAG: hypothetical protein H0W62_10560 [Chitinophagales bacterium]|nr:hypothetical protein [Chitinophagales bacterium]
MRKNITFCLCFIFLIVHAAFSQQDLSAIVDENAPKEPSERVSATFKGYKIINAQTIETAKKRNLFFNIAHRFGDIGGIGGGAHSLYGFDVSTDIVFSFDYGITDNLQIGIGRAKGIQPYTELYDGNIKYKLLEQTVDDKMPVSVSLYGIAGISGRRPSIDTTSDAAFDDLTQRTSYVTQAIIARKFSQRISFEVLPTWVHRNYVIFGDKNDFFSLGIGGRAKLTKRFALIFDYFHNFSSFQEDAVDANGKTVFFDPLSVGVEIETGGHVFTLSFTNSTGILENSWLPETRSNWLDGQFRFGFNISRNFVIGGKSW